MENSHPPARALPVIIQGGMGVAVSNWKLARAVAAGGHLGVVSGTALAAVLVRRLQDGDPGGDIRRALAHCPLQAAAQAIAARYFLAGGRSPGQPYRLAPMYSVAPPDDLVALTIVANFVEVWLAKEGHAGVVGLNLLEKIQLPTLASLYGAMLADVNYVLMGAGIPRAIPGILDQLARGQKVELRIAVAGETPGVEHRIGFDPAHFTGTPVPALRRPQFLAIVSSSALATTLARKASGKIDGLVIEGATAGGHNAPPRGAPQFNALGEPIYSPRDSADLGVIRALGLPFWLAGSYAHPTQLRAALALGATGVQIGTAFAFCEESGLRPESKREVLRQSASGTVELRTDPRASPTGMPFKVVDLSGTVSVPAVYEHRARVCDLGFLRQPYENPDGSVGYRCPAEPVGDFVRKGGDPADAVGRKCLCNGLMAAIGLGQSLVAGVAEPAIVTAGEDVRVLRRFLADGEQSYGAADVLRFMLTGLVPAC
ncbi:MAG: nitronate monooxygenase [Opitutaceae bacterium]|nr:nitronate monooxygenase [Opitutaceae bacterium]